MKRSFLLAAACLPALLRADQITLLNGDRITGTIVTSDEKALVVKTESMGEVRIGRAAIATLTSDSALTVTLKKGERLVGRVQAPDAKTVLIETAEPVRVPYQEVAAIRTAAAQAAWEREQERLTRPRFNDFWSGTVGLNLAAANGNATTLTFGTGATAQRITGFDKIALTYSQIYSRQKTVVPFGATANRVSGGVRYDRNFDGRLFGFGFNSYDYDRFLDLDLRVVLGAGLGYHAYKSATSYWDIGAGGNWNREAFGSGLTRNSAEIIVTESSSHQVSALLKLLQRLDVFPNLTRTGAYRVDFDGGASFRLTRALSWNVNVTDRYLSDPLPGKKKNDVLLTTGIGISFEQK